MIPLKLYLILITVKETHQKVLQVRARLAIEDSAGQGILCNLSKSTYIYIIVCFDRVVTEV